MIDTVSLEEEMAECGIRDKREKFLFLAGKLLGDETPNYEDRRDSYDYWYEDEGYSGRGMFGKVAVIAIISDISPVSEAGEAFMELSGARVDNMGLNFIYY